MPIRPRKLKGAAAVVALTSLLSFLGSCAHCHPPPTVPDAGSPDAGATPLTPLSGFVDLHTHPMANLGFAGKLVYGGPDWADGGALLPADPDCHENVRAATLAQALGHDNSTHGGIGIDNLCGDSIRQLVVSALQQLNGANDPPPDASGAPAFPQWPTSNDVSHQAIWIDGIRRDYDAGLRVMVMLAVNNQTLADAVAGWNDGPDDDQSSADLQVEELKGLVARHSDFMEVAYTADDLQRIVAGGKLAVVLGIEVDNLGDFNTRGSLSHADIHAEVKRLHDEGVRYVFPIHVLDNPFGTTAAYQDIFDLSNLREAGHFWHLVCADPSQGITYHYTMGNPLLDPFSSTQSAEMAALMILKLHLFSLDDPNPPACPADGGVVNRGVPYAGLTPDGVFLLQDLMQQGFFIDVDHMSQASVDDALNVAVDAGCPVNSGHNWVRADDGGFASERSLTAAQYARVASVHGMAGVGSAQLDQSRWMTEVSRVQAAMGRDDAFGFGTDTDGVSPLMPRPPSGSPPVVYSGAYPMSQLGTKSWDYNTEGVAHYGMISDFVKGVSLAPGGAAVTTNLMKGAQYFHDEWTRVEACSARLTPAPAIHPLAMMAAPHPCPQGQVFRPACNRCLAPRERCPRCGETDAGTCLPPPQCPAPRRLNPWGVCERPDLTAAAPRGLPFAGQLKRESPVKGVSVAPGTYALKLEVPAAAAPRGEALEQSFKVELTPSGRGLGFKPGRQAKPVVSTGGFVKGLFVMQLEVGLQRLLLVARPQPGERTLHGGFVLLRQGKRPLTGDFTLDSAAGKTLQPYEALGGFLAPLAP